MAQTDNTKSSGNNTQEKINVETDICFKVVGNDDVYNAKSKTLSTTDLSFNTDHPLKAGMLLQMTMKGKEQNSPALQTIVEVVKVEPLTDKSGFHVSSSIKDIAIGM